MSFLKSFLDSFASPTDSSSSESQVIREISNELKGLSAQESEFVAAYAFLLGRVAYADQDVSSEELGRIADILKSKASLSEGQAGLIAKMVQSLNENLGGTENYLVAREFHGFATHEQKKDLIDALFAVAAADESVSSEEEKEIKLIASELKLSANDVNLIRSKYRAFRDVLKGMPTRD